MILAAEIYPADHADTQTLVDSVLEAVENVKQAGAETEIKEIVADKGYHAAETIELADDLNFRTYIPERKQQHRSRWTDKPAEFQQAVYANRRRLKRAKSRKLQRLRSERCERTFAHVCDTGGMRRSWLKKVVNVSKRYLIAAAAHNLGRILRKLFGVGKPRTLQDLAGSCRACAASRGTLSHASSALRTDDVARLVVRGPRRDRVNHREKTPYFPGLLEQQGRLIFLPQGGGPVLANADRLALLGCPQFYLLDREAGSITEQRRRVAAAINNHPGAYAFVTQKRALENYLHPAAIFDARRLAVEFTDDDDVATLVARRQWESASNSGTWFRLPHRVRHRQRSKAKLWLNTAAAEQMTIERLAQRDPSWEILSWFTTVRDLL